MTTDYVALRCLECGHWKKGAFTKEQVAEWLRVHVRAGLGPNAERLTIESICPHPCGTPFQASHIAQSSDPQEAVHKDGTAPE